MRARVGWVVLAACLTAGTFHETATVDGSAVLGTDAYVDAFAQVGAWVTLGDRTIVAPRAVLEGATTSSAGTSFGADSIVGRRTTVESNCSLGADTTLGRSVTMADSVTGGSQLTVLYGSQVGPEVVFGERVTVGALATLGQGVELADDVVIARGAVIGDNARIGVGAIIGPEAVIEAGAIIGAGARLRKQVTVRADAVVGDGARIGRDVEVAANATIAGGVVVRANSYIGTWQEVTGYVERGSDLPDLPEPTSTLVLVTNGRAWSDGTEASSCDAYRNPPAGYEYAGETGSGRYLIRPTAQISAFPVYCDMETPGVGWTLVAKVDRAHSDVAMSEPRGWFGQGSARNPSQLLDTVSRDTNSQVSTHGNARLAKLGEAGISQARFTLIAEDDVNQRVTWYKAIVDQSFLDWFSATPHTATAVCQDPSMTVGCSTGDILSGSTTNLDGMIMSDQGYAGGVVHMRLDEDGSPHFDAMCSSTGNNNGNAWRDDAIDGHWGNGLEIWVR